MKNKKAFTLIEILVIVAIIGILATVILVMIIAPKSKARINGAKTSLKTVLPAIIACKDGGGTIKLTDGGGTLPVAGDDICVTAVGLNGAKWPALLNNYAYKAGNYNSNSCTFPVSTNGDSADLNCDCVKQICQ